MEVNFHRFLPSALGGGEWSAYATVSLSQKDADTHWKGGKMGPISSGRESYPYQRSNLSHSARSLIPDRGRYFSSVHMGIYPAPFPMAILVINYHRVYILKILKPF
jgi:hypothetical protein